MATLEEDYDSLASQAIAFLHACQPAFPPTVTPANIAQYLRSGVVLCKFVTTHHSHTHNSTSFLHTSGPTAV